MKKFLNKDNMATISGYTIAILNSIIVLDIDKMVYTLPSTWLKLIVAIVMPIVGGHITEVKTNSNL